MLVAKCCKRAIAGGGDSDAARCEHNDYFSMSASPPDDDADIDNDGGDNTSPEPSDAPEIAVDIISMCSGSPDDEHVSTGEAPDDVEKFLADNVADSITDLAIAEYDPFHTEAEVADQDRHTLWESLTGLFVAACLVVPVTILLAWLGAAMSYSTGIVLAITITLVSTEVTYYTYVHAPEAEWTWGLLISAQAASAVAAAMVESTPVKRCCAAHRTLNPDGTTTGRQCKSTSDVYE